MRRLIPVVLLLAAAYLLSAQSILFPGPGTSTGGSSETSWITSFTPGLPHSVFDGTVGVKITVGGSNVVTTKVGRYCVATNSGTHTFHVNHNNVSDNTTVSINMSGCTAGTFVYVALVTTLLANEVYYLGTEETSAGDLWLDNDSTVAVTSVAADSQSCYQSGGYGPTNWSATGGAGTMFVGIDFKY